MIKNFSCLAIIPARGGSKGIPRKNIRKIAGKPLIAWTIETAKKSKYLDRLILSSEDDEIIAVARQWGCEVPFKRPKELALDETPGIEPILHAMKMLPGYDLIVVLQPTSPLRSVEDIDLCIEKCVNNNANACVSVTEQDKSPYWMYSLDEKEYLRPIVSLGGLVTRRQDLPKAFALNGAVYVGKSDWLNKKKNFLTEETLAYIMPKERSLDIDTYMDFKICEWFLSLK